MSPNEQSAASPVRIKVVGVGNGGGNAVNRMIDEDLESIEFISVNTDVQALKNSKSHIKIQLGTTLTRGLGAGGRPDLGRAALKENADEVRKALRGSDLVFIIAGIGGGTGTGAGPLIAEMAREMGALTIAIVTRPFLFEGKKRTRQAEQGLADLKRVVDTLIVISNEQLLKVVGKGTSFKDALRKADEVLMHGTLAITDLIRVTGEVNVDLTDVQTIMSNRGEGLMGIGSGRGANRGVEAAQQAISSPLLDNTSIQGAAGVLINITGGVDLAIDEVTTISSIIQDAAGDQAEIIFGAVHDSSMTEEVRVTVIATGFTRSQGMQGDEQPVLDSTLKSAIGTPDSQVGESDEFLDDEPPLESPAKPTIIVAWDPQVVDPDDYAEVIGILGELTRLEGAKGISRIRSEGFGVPALDEVFA